MSYIFGGISRRSGQGQAKVSLEGKGREKWAGGSEFGPVDKTILASITSTDTE